MRYIAAAVSDKGISKPVNQDSVCVKVADSCRGQTAMAVLCDGMGGLAKGELASGTVIRAFSDWFDTQLPKRLSAYSWQALSAEWERLIHAQNLKILAYGKERGFQLGTTLSAILILEDKYMIAHVGDSRVYRITDKAEQLTEDQTFVAQEMKAGRMTPAQAESDARRNMLLQCVGACAKVHADFLFGSVRPNTVFMLCSDGFRHVLSSAEFAESYNPRRADSVDDLEQSSKRLIDIAKSRREKDNITVSLIKCI